MTGEEETIGTEGEDVTEEEEAVLRLRAGRRILCPSRFLAVTKVQQSEWKEEEMEKQ